MVDENRIQGGARELAGKAQGAAGNLTGDSKMQAEGGVREAAGKAQGTYGEAKDKARDAAGDVGSAARETSDKARQAGAEVADQARDAYGQAKAAVSEAADNAGDELARLRAQVEELMRDRVKPALSDAASIASGYAHEAKQAVAGQAERATATVREQPMIALAVMGAVAFVIGRLTADRD